MTLSGRVQGGKAAKAARSVDDELYEKNHWVKIRIDKKAWMDKG
jgi:hypothetical protein